MFLPLLDPNDPASAEKGTLQARWFYSKTKEERLEIIQRAKELKFFDLAKSFEERMDEPFFF